MALWSKEKGPYGRDSLSCAHISKPVDSQYMPVERPIRFYTGTGYRPLGQMLGNTLANHTKPPLAKRDFYHLQKRNAFDSKHLRHGYPIDELINPTIDLLRLKLVYYGGGYARQRYGYGTT